MANSRSSLCAGLVLTCCGFVSFVAGQDVQRPVYLNPALPAQERAADLVHRMTLAEKASQLVNQARAIPRLGIPAYDWWSESLHGVIGQGTTEFPEPIGLAATFDTAGIGEMGTAIGVEGRIKHAQAVKAGHSDTFEGLDFWAPNLNIFRDPRWGRGQETYGEDPFLTAEMGVAFVKGMQGDDPKYYRVIATPKHYAVHSGPEPTRHVADVTVSKHDELDTYLPAFRAAVIDGKADSIMCAYNSINGQPACANQFLLQDELRGKWGFQGYVVSDCGAAVDIFQGHHFVKSQPEAAAIALKTGMDNECADPPFKVTDDHDYRPYIEAVQQGLVSEAEIDTAVIRLFTARMKLGMFDPPEVVPYNRIDAQELDSAAHRALALRLANESMVLLKNAGVLPLKPSDRKIALIGPLAEETQVLLGNYSGHPTHTVSILEGMRKEFGEERISFVPGTQFLSHHAEPVPASLLSTDGRPGVKVTYARLDMSDVNHPKELPPVAERVEQTIDTAKNPLPPAAQSVTPLQIRYEAKLTPKEAGDYELGVYAAGSYAVQVNGRPVTSGYEALDQPALGPVHLEAGKPADVVVRYQPFSPDRISARLVWSKLDVRPSAAAMAAARKADVVVAVVGLSGDLEGEEKQVDEPGFKGGDRTSLDLPKPEEDLIEALAQTGKPLVVVLTNGSALAVNWANEHANAILEAWYPGEEGGTAVAETLSGKNNPAGRLPVTFYTGVDQLPPFESYAMQGRTYRYFQGEPLYPFGFGLSYTKFAYKDLTLSTNALAAGSQMTAEVTVTNAGERDGDEVAQLYLTFPDIAGAPLRALRGFQRVHLKPGALQRLRFVLSPRDLSIVTDAGDRIVGQGEYSVAIGGGQPGTRAASVATSFRVNGTQRLPE